MKKIIIALFVFALVKFSFAQNPPLEAYTAVTQIDSTQLPYTLSLAINLGSASMPVTGVLGIAFDLFFDAECTDTTALTSSSVTYPAIWGTFGTNYSRLEDFSNKAIGKISFGITRFGVAGISSNGSNILIVNFKINDACYGGWYRVTPSVLGCNDASGNPIVLSPVGDSVRVVKNKCFIALSKTSTNVTCQGLNNGSASVTASNGTLPYTYHWSNGSNSPNITALSSGTYYVTVTDAVCSKYDTLVIQPATAINNNVSLSGPSTFCVGGSLTLTAVAGYTYNWSTGSTNQNITVNQNGTYTVTVTDVNSCTASSIPTVVTVNSMVTPSVNITANPSGTICSGTNVTFSATPNNGGNSPAYQWKVNGNNVGTNAATYTSNTLTNGNIVTCVLTSNAVCASPTTATSNSITMVVNPTVVPSVSIVANPSGSICAGTSVTFTATPTNGGGTPAYQWKVNGSNVGTNSSTFTSNTLANGNTVTCVLTSNASCASPVTATSNSITMSVSGSVTPSVIIVANPSGAVCIGTGVTFTATPSGGGSTPAYQWKLNGNNAGTNAATYTITPANGDVISCVLTSNASCASPLTATSNSITMSISGTVTPTISIAANPSSTVCVGDNVTFNATSSGGGSTPSYQWQVNSINVGSNTSTFSSNSLNNTDVVTCILTSSATCASIPTANSNSITMTVTPTVVPSLNIVANPNGLICSGASVTFTVTPTNGGSSPVYQWKVNSGNVGSNSATYTNSSLTNSDIVSCILSSNATCATPSSVTSNSITMAVTTSVTPDVNIVANPSGSICSGTNVTFTATPTNGGISPSYLWKKNTNNVGSNNTVYSDNTLTSSDVITCELTSNAVCVSQTTVTSNSVSVTVNPAPGTTITPAGSTTICQGDSVLLNAPAGNPTYSWNTGATTQSIFAKFAGNYTVTVTNINNCSAISSPVTIIVNSLPATPLITRLNDTITSSPASSYQWYLNNNAIGGATNQSYVMSQSGQYEVEITDTNGCRNMSTIYNANSVGINEVTLDYNVKIFPNPTSNELTLESAWLENNKAMLTLFDVTGKLLTLSYSQEGNKVILHTADLAGGLYWVKIEINGNTVSKRFVKVD